MAVRFRFYAEFCGPGFHEVHSFWAENLSDAERQACGHAGSPWKGWPRHKPSISVEVFDDWDVAIFDDGRTMLRRDYEREFGNAAA